MGNYENNSSGMILTRFDVDPGGCHRTEEIDDFFTRMEKIGWFFVMGGELRRYEVLDREGRRMTLVVEVRENRYEGEDLTVFLWEWEVKNG
ncbi:hypothetical protein [Rhodococcus qingshengii]|uniref:hypothetical protein n=1 Tax=Rhodococcus qingshengii TaxID=334542 RepID=UPI0035D92C72